VHEPVFLDRDGVMNENVPDYVRSLDQWVPIPGALEAAAVLSMAGHPVVVITNQSAIGRKLMPESTVREINLLLESRVKAHGGSLSGVYFCPHSPEDACSCRKPRTGLVDSARAELGLPPGGWLVGDAATDLELGRASGLCTVLVLTGRGRDQLETIRSRGLAEPDITAESLHEAARIIIQADEKQPSGGGRG
jgi:D-glycero-D-manno-heptose 1,7-bisphosphate phosphatase